MTREDALDDIFWHRGISAVEHTAINTVDTVWLLRIDVQKYVTKIFNDHEELTDKLHKAYAEADYECKALSVQLKAKKEENNNLHRLMGQNTETINEAKKARSIVAMLFWEWRKSEARIYATNIKWKTGRAFQSQILFEAAYKILKEQQ